MMVPVVCSFSTSQPEDELMQNYVEMEGNFSLTMSYHYEYWLASHLDSHEQQSIQSLHGLSYSSVWLKEGRSMKSGWFFLHKKFQVDKTWEGVFCESSWTRMFQTLVASFHPLHGWL
jgi:hypothetical protein